MQHIIPVELQFLPNYMIDNLTYVWQHSFETYFIYSKVLNCLSQLYKHFLSV